MGLANYKGIIGTAASISSFVLLLAPSILCMKIWKNKSSNNVPFSPLMESMARSILMVQQGLIMGVWPIVVTHSIGLLLNLSYITIYLNFTKDKGEAQKCILRWSAMLAPFTAYALYEDKTLLEARFGTIVTTFTISLMLYHLYAVKYVIASKSTKDLPFPMLVAALCVTFLWTLYGIAIDKPAIQTTIQTGELMGLSFINVKWCKDAPGVMNIFVIMGLIQTGTAFCVCAIELSLFAIYPSKPLDSEEKPDDTKDLKKRN